MNFRTLKFALFSMLIVTSSFAFADPFGELDSYDRQQRNSDSAFEDLEREFQEASPTQAQPKPQPPKVIERVETRIVVVEKEPVVTRKATPPPPANNNDARVFSKNNLLFTLNGCTKSHSDVTCNLTVLNKGPDKEITVFSTNKYRSHESTSFFDNAGNQYFAYSGTFGSKKTGHHGHGGGAKNRLIQGIATKTIMQFQNIKDETTSISLLELKVEDDKKFNVTFRNVPLS